MGFRELIHQDVCWRFPEMFTEDFAKIGQACEAAQFTYFRDGIFTGLKQFHRMVYMLYF